MKKRPERAATLNRRFEGRQRSCASNGRSERAFERGRFRVSSVQNERSGRAYAPTLLFQGGLAPNGVPARA